MSPSSREPSLGSPEVPALDLPGFISRWPVSCYLPRSSLASALDMQCGQGLVVSMCAPPSWSSPGTSHITQDSRLSNNQRFSSRSCWVHTAFSLILSSSRSHKPKYTSVQTFTHFFCDAPKFSPVSSICGSMRVISTQPY